jgi:hypothetical protein
MLPSFYNFMVFFDGAGREFQILLQSREWLTQILTSVISTSFENIKFEGCYFWLVPAKNYEEKET